MAQLDRSRIEVRQACARRRYWAYDYAGTGLTKVGPNVVLENGLAGHALLERVLMGAHIDEAVEAIMPDFRQQLSNDHAFLADDDREFLVEEQSFLIEGLVRGFAKIRMPRLLEEFVPLEAEQEFVVPLPNGDDVLMVRLDLPMRRRGDGAIVILDYKTLSYLTEDWQTNKEKSLQTVLYPWAYEQHTGEYVAGIQYEGLLKGIQKRDTSTKSRYQGRRIQVSPLCYGYSNGTEFSSVYTSKKGWERVAWWEAGWTPERVVALLEKEQVLAPLYNTIPPVKWDGLVVERILKQIQSAEAQYRDAAAVVEALPVTIDTVFEMNLGQCFKYGAKHACPFIELCHHGQDVEQAIADGAYTPRIPHHTSELQQQQEVAAEDNIA